MSSNKLSRLLRRKLQKFARLRQRISGGNFSAGDVRARCHHNYLVAKLYKLRKQIIELNGSLRIATVAGALIFAANAANAQIPIPGLGPNALGPFTPTDRAHNPLRPGIYADIQFKPTAVDLDKDGDLDLVMGTYGDGHNSGYRYFRNDGTPTKPGYIELTEKQNPFNYVTSWSAPSFADLDKDGDLDMFTGEEQNDSDSPTNGSIHYFVNNNGKFWTETTPGDFDTNEQKGAWNSTTRAGNPAHQLIYKTHVMPAFVDLDKDGDQDLMVSTDFDAEPTAVSYFLNDGSGNLSVSDFHPYTTWYNEDLNFGDVDEDGDADLVIGDIDGGIHFFSNDGTGTFTEQTGAWDGSAKTGNPFDGLWPSQFDGDYFETSLTLGDFNGDGHIDAIVGFRNGSYPYFVDNVPYFLRNNGHGTYEKVRGLDDDPLDGAGVAGVATVDFQDINGDGEKDAIVSGTRYNYVDLYLGGSGEFKLANSEVNPLNSDRIGIRSDGASGIFVDFDGDKDLDFVSSTWWGHIEYFKNIDGEYVLQPNDATNPFHTDELAEYNNDFGVVIMSFVDIDSDKDLDLFIGEKYGYVDFFRNDNGVLSRQGHRDADTHEPLDNLNPLGSIMTPQPYYGGGNSANIRFVDLDNDGDFDALIGHSRVSLDSDGFNIAEAEVLYHENTGTAQVPSFTERQSPFDSDDLGDTPLLTFIDFDKDGDLDAFMGYQAASGTNIDGHFKYFINTNPAPVVTGAATVQYQSGAVPVLLDANMNLSDPDDDMITRMTVSIQGFEAGKEVLTFTPKAPVSGSFSATTGVLTLSGKGTAADYAAVLKTVAYQFTGQKPASGGRRPSPGSKTILVTKTINVAALDADMTAGAPKVLSLQITFPNSAPTIATSATATKYLNTSTIVDSGVTITDADDATMAGATIKFDPSLFSTTEDALEFPAQNGITGTFSAATGTLTLAGQSSAANYQAALRSIAYKNFLSSPTAGDRIIQFSVSDGETSSNTASRSMTVDAVKPPDIPVPPPAPTNIVVYNALSPNGDNLNSIFLIENLDVLEPGNKVTIFDRWGAKVFDVQDYDNRTKVFTGHSNGGSELPNGVYFYRVEFLGTSGRSALEGFLSIRR